MTSNIYLNKRIKKRLIPFLKKHYNIEDVLFWTDMASIHYSTKVTDLLNDERIDFVSYDVTALCVPQARLIEKYWASCKKEYKELHMQ